jgi:hypothetical protein
MRRLKHRLTTDAFFMGRAPLSWLKFHRSLTGLLHEKVMRSCAKPLNLTRISGQ